MSRLPPARGRDFETAFAHVVALVEGLSEDYGINGNQSSAASGSGSGYSSQTAEQEKKLEEIARKEKEISTKIEEKTKVLLSEDKPQLSAVALQYSEEISKIFTRFDAVATSRNPSDVLEQIIESRHVIKSVSANFAKIEPNLLGLVVEKERLSRELAAQKAKLNLIKINELEERLKRIGKGISESDFPAAVKTKVQIVVIKGQDGIEALQIGARNIFHVADAQYKLCKMFLRTYDGTAVTVEEGQDMVERCVGPDRGKSKGGSIFDPEVLEMFDKMRKAVLADHAPSQAVSDPHSSGSLKSSLDNTRN